MEIDPAPPNSSSPPPASDLAIEANSAAAMGTPGLEAKYSCLTCHRRKVKCDRGRPCSNCARNSSECEYRAPPAPRRKKKGGDQLLLAKLARYEEHLKKLGVEVEEPGNATGISQGDDDLDEHGEEEDFDDGTKRLIRPSTVKEEQGTLVLDSGKARYLENKLWVSISGELQQNNKAFLQEQREYQSNEDDDSIISGNDNFADSLIFGRSGKEDPMTLFPSPSQIRVLWSAFRSNVDPLTKVVHAPTVEKMILLSTHNPHAIPRNMITLLFSVFLVSAESLSDDECQLKLGQPRSKLLRRFSYATQKCLIRSGMLKTTDLIILTALLFYILSLRYDLDPQTIWSLAGILLRTAQRIGLHRDYDDAGIGAKLSPFEREIRRRVWKQILILDWHSSEHAGTTNSHSFFNTPFVNPKNLDDSDLDPSMRTDPPEREGATDMIFCCLRNEFGKFFILEHPREHGLEFHGKPTSDMTMEEKDKFIDEMERQIELRYVRYCDPINPLHLLVTMVARSALCSMRLRAHHPMHYSDGGKTMAPEERAKLFEWSLRALRYDNTTLSTPSLRKYSWHCRSFFQYHPFIYLLVHVRHARVGTDVEEAWKELDKAYNTRPALMERRTGLCTAAAALALRAWEAREAELKRIGHHFEIPDFIQKLRLSADSVASSQASVSSGTIGNSGPPKKMMGKGTARQQEWFNSGSSQQTQAQAARTPSGSNPSGGRTNWTFNPIQQNNFSPSTDMSPASNVTSTGTNNFQISPSMMNQQPWASWANPRPNVPIDSLANLDTNAENWTMWEQLMQNPDMNMYNNDGGFNSLDGFFVPMGGN